MKTFKPEVKPGRPIACPILVGLVDEARKIPAKMMAGSGAPQGTIEADHWMDRCLAIAESASNAKNFETNDWDYDRYEASRAVAMESIWDVYSFLQTAPERSTRATIWEDRSEREQRERMGIQLESWEEYCSNHSE